MQSDHEINFKTHQIAGNFRNNQINNDNIELKKVQKILLETIDLK